MKMPASKLTKYWPLLAVIFFVAAFPLSIPRIQVLNGWEILRTDSARRLHAENVLMDQITRLKNLPEENPKRLEVREQLAANYLARSRFDSAQEIYLDILRIKTAHKQDVQGIYLSLAELYRCMGDFVKAEQYYKMIWDYDKEHLDKNDPKIVRDLNNQGTICYLIAMSTEDKLIRELELNRSNFFLIQAEIASSDRPKKDPQDEANIWDNRALVVRELGNINEASALKQKAKAVHEKVPQRLIPP
jgi:tetratricopeptide (TPR) repeat protein